MEDRPSRWIIEEEELGDAEARMVRMGDRTDTQFE